MIIDKLKNAHLYFSLSDGIKTSFEYLMNIDLQNIANGKYEIDGDNIFVIVQDYDTKPEMDGKFEAHRKYIDIQYIIKGVEKLGYSYIENCTAVSDYDESKDIIFLDGKGDFVEAEENTFLIFMPQDAHMPRIMKDNPEYLKKAVIKIKV